MIARRPTYLTAQTITGTAMRLTLGLVLAAAVLIAPSMANAADDNNEDAAWDTKILRGLLEGIGLQRDEKVINYQERAPLVIPPTKVLPPPERSDALIVNNPAWPKDPDVLRAQQDARERNVFTSADEAIRRDQRPLRPDEMTPGPKPRNASRVARTTQQAGSSSEKSETGQRLTPSQLGNTGGLFGRMFSGTDDETARFTGEPPRASLTEPPPGYQTPSPDQPYGMTDRSKTPTAANPYLERGTRTDK